MKKNATALKQLRTSVTRLKFIQHRLQRLVKKKNNSRGKSNNFGDNSDSKNKNFGQIKIICKKIKIYPRDKNKSPNERKKFSDDRDSKN